MSERIVRKPGTASPYDPQFSQRRREKLEQAYQRALLDAEEMGRRAGENFDRWFSQNFEREDKDKS